MKEYMDIEELSDYLGIKKSTLYAKVASKQIPDYKIDRLVRFKKTAIDRWMEGLRKEPTDIGHYTKNISKGLNIEKRDIDGLVKNSIEVVKGKRV